MSRKFSIGVHAHGDDVHDASPKISAVVQLGDDGARQLIELTVAAVDGGPISPSVARNIDFTLLAAGLNSIIAATLPPTEGGVAVAAAMPVALPVAAQPIEADDPEAAEAEPAAKERPYRRMPDVDEVKAVMERTQSVGKVERHFDVPRYTAQAWSDRMRRTGQLADRPQATAD